MRFEGSRTAFLQDACGAACQLGMWHLSLQQGSMQAPQSVSADPRSKRTGASSQAARARRGRCWTAASASSCWWTRRTTCRARALRSTARRACCGAACGGRTRGCWRPRARWCCSSCTPLWRSPAAPPSSARAGRAPSGAAPSGGAGLPAWAPASAAPKREAAGRPVRRTCRGLRHAGGGLVGVLREAAVPPPQAPLASKGRECANTWLSCTSRCSLFCTARPESVACISTGCTDENTFCPDMTAC